MNYELIEPDTEIHNKGMIKNYFSRFRYIGGRGAQLIKKKIPIYTY